MFPVCLRGSYPTIPSTGKALSLQKASALQMRGLASTALEGPEQIGARLGEEDHAIGKTVGRLLQFYRACDITIRRLSETLTLKIQLSRKFSKMAKLCSGYISELKKSSEGKLQTVKLENKADILEFARSQKLEVSGICAGGAFVEEFLKRATDLETHSDGSARGSVGLELKDLFNIETALSGSLTNMESINAQWSTRLQRLTQCSNTIQLTVNTFQGLSSDSGKLFYQGIR